MVRGDRTHPEATRGDCTAGVPLSRILGGDREIVIEFNGADYRLRITPQRETDSHEVVGRRGNRA